MPSTEDDRVAAPPVALFERLEVVEDDAPHGAALNMALDEVLLLGLGDWPRLRLYRWDAASVSFGYFERIVSVRSAFSGRTLVRRWTGGGIVEHGADLTYSLMVPRPCALARERTGESYRLIHRSLAFAMRKAGWSTAGGIEEAASSISSMPEAGFASGPANTCFSKPVRYDLLSGGSKIAGAAQRRTRAGLLHQGSVQPPTGGEADGEALCKLWNHLPETLAAQIHRRPLGTAELDAATALASVKYGATRWRERF